MLDTSALPLRELLATSIAISTELRRRGYVRTGTSLAGELMEHVVAAAYDARLEAPVNAGWDAVTNDGTRIQVKTRFLEPGARRPFTFKTLDFDIAVIVWINAASFTIDWAREIPRVELEAIAAPHSAGFRLSASRAMAHEADVTSRLRAAFDALA